MSQEVVLLVSVADQGEADVICSLLRVEGIACSTRAPFAGEAGASGEGFHGSPSEVYVHESDRERALELLTAVRAKGDAL
jgi:hypothetical protein